MTGLLSGWTPDPRSWLTLFVDGSEFLHVVPSFGRAHALSMRCWCHPAIDDEAGEAVVSHNVAH